MRATLSILVCSVNDRVSDFLPVIIASLNAQAAAFDGSVQILFLGDNKTMTVGRKRNELVAISDGVYVAFVDDDDIVEKNYVSELMKATKENADVIVFDVMRYENGVKDKVARYDIAYMKDENRNDIYLRVPNHLMCWRRDIAMKASFMNINFGEDGIWAKQVRQFAVKQHRIEKVLYRYMFDIKKTETQKRA